MVDIDETGKFSFEVNIGLDLAEGQLIVQAAGGFIVVQLCDVKFLDTFKYDVFYVNTHSVEKELIISQRGIPRVFL